MSLITLSGVASTSAPTRAQKEAAIYLFGSKGHSIVSVLDKFARAKEIRAPHLNGLLKLLKDAEDEEIIKFAASAAGKKTVANAKVFATAKTLAASIKALRLIRVPQKWIEGHSDVAAARIAETKEIRARRTAGNKPEKPIKLDNPGAAEAETVDQTKPNAKVSKVWLAQKFSRTDASSWSALQKAFNDEFKDLGFVAKFVKREGALRLQLPGGYPQIRKVHIGLDERGKRPEWFLYAVAPEDKQGAGIDGRSIGPRLTLASIIAVIRDYMTNGPTSPDAIKLNARIAGARVYDQDTNPHNPIFDEYIAKEAKARRDPEAPITLAKLNKNSIGKATGGMLNGLSIEINKVLKDTPIYATNFIGKNGAYGLKGFIIDMHISKRDQPFNLAGVILIPPQVGTALKGDTWRARGIKIGREELGAEYSIGSKLTAAGVNKAYAKIVKEPIFAKAAMKQAYTPTNKSDITLVDELAEVTARKISAKPLQAREEYFKALRNVLQKNLPKAIVSTISNGVTVTTKRDFIIALEDNAWTLKIGITGKPKKIGATFDIVDLLGMIDKSILRPKSDGGNKRPEPPYFERIKKNAAGEYTTQIQANENVAYAAHFKREGDTFVFSTPVYSDVQRFITQGMSETGIKWETFTGRSVTFSKTDADKFEKWVKSIKRSQPLTSNKTFPAIAPKPRGGGMSM